MKERWRVSAEELELAIAGRHRICSQGDLVPLVLSKPERFAFERAKEVGYLRVRHGRRPNLSNAWKYYCGAQGLPCVKIAQLSSLAAEPRARVYYDMLWAGVRLEPSEVAEIRQLFADFASDIDLRIGPVWGAAWVYTDDADMVADILLRIGQRAIKRARQHG